MKVSDVQEVRGAAAGRAGHHANSTNARLTAAAAASPIERRRLLDEVIVANIDLARTVARRYANRGVATEDLEQVACMALVRAANRFDPARADDFRTFAVPTIRGEVKRYFRDHAWTVRPVRRVQETQALIAQDAAHAEGRDQDPAAIAERLGLDVEDVREAIGAHGCFHAKSLDAPVTVEGGVSFGDTLADDFDEHDAAEARVMLRDLVTDLAPRDRLIIYLRFFEGRTQSEIGEEIGCSQMHVSRLLNRILADMRRRASSKAGAAQGRAADDRDASVA